MDRYLQLPTHFAKRSLPNVRSKAAEDDLCFGYCSRATSLLITTECEIINQTSLVIRVVNQKQSSGLQLREKPNTSRVFQNQLIHNKPIKAAQTEDYEFRRAVVSILKSFLSEQAFKRQC